MGPASKVRSVGCRSAGCFRLWVVLRPHPRGACIWETSPPRFWRGCRSAAKAAGLSFASRISTTAPAAARGPSCSWMTCVGWARLGRGTLLPDRAPGPVWCRVGQVGRAGPSVPLFLHARRASCRKCAPCQRRHACVRGHVSRFDERAGRRAFRPPAPAVRLRCRGRRPGRSRHGLGAGPP